MEKVLYNQEIVVGIGKLKFFVTDALPFEIPTLSFVVSKDDCGNFTAVCIQLLVNGFGETPQSAINDMKNICTEYLETLFTNKETAWDKLQNVYSDDFANDIWKVYRKFQLNLAKNGISTDSKEIYMRKIADLEKQIVDLKTALEESASRTVYTKVVDYQEVA